MWAHYAGNSSGVCLVFNFSKHDNYLKMLRKVNYRNAFIVAEDVAAVEQVAIQKRSDWHYEKE
jgi:hypothetical protein